MNDKDLIVAYCTACETAQKHKPENASYFSMLRHLALTEPYFPVAVNLAWLLEDFDDCFSKDDYQYYLRIMANAVHSANARG